MQGMVERGMREGALGLSSRQFYVPGAFTVRWSQAGGERRLRITPPLIRVADEAQVWADDAVFADVFAVQSGIAAHTDRAGLLAYLGRKEHAVRAARDLVRRDPISEDGTNGPGTINTAAEIFALFGEDEEALKQLEVVLSGPSYNSAAMVRVNPVWRRFHGNARFEALLAKYP